MRSTQQVLDLLLDFARSREEIRVVVMNGSRVNPNAPKDLFCDYDIACFVPNPRVFLEDPSWLDQFGERVMFQQNEWVDRGAEGFIWLQLFVDGVRIDLSFNHLSNLPYLNEDTLTLLLLDKDNHVPPLPPSSDRGYLVARPSPKEFAETLNNIFWCSNNLAKGLWRGELAYVKSMQDEIIRPCILKLLAWYAADRHAWTVDTGKFGKWLQKYLPPEIWQAYLKTYSGADPDEIWESVFAALVLVRQVGLQVAASLTLTYPLEDDRRMLTYLQRVRSLPPDALSFDEE